MPDASFEHALPLALRAVQVRAGFAVATGRAPASDRKDLEQEALLGLFLSLPRYDASRAGLRTFLERVADKRFASLLRRRRTDILVEHLEGHRIATADGIPAVQLRVDFQNVLAQLSASSRETALLLIDHRPAEISHILGIARSTVYARIAKLRRAFVAAGYGPAGARGGAR